MRIVMLAVMMSALASAQAFADAPSCSNLVGSWHNQLGSTLTITSVDKSTNQLSGTYRSPSGTGGEEHPLVGWLNASKNQDKKKDNVVVLAFSVSWGEDYGSITSWTGYCAMDGGVATITALWHLVKASSGFSWNHIITNMDKFTPGAASAKSK